MDRIGQLFLLLNFKTLALTVVAVLATYVCIETGLKANFPLTVITIGVVFPKPSRKYSRSTLGEPGRLP